MNKDIKVNKTKYISVKKQNPIKRIAQPTPITTLNKFEEFEGMDIEIKTPLASETQNKKKSHISKLKLHGQ